MIIKDSVDEFGRFADTEVYEYDDSIGRHHLAVSNGNGTRDVYEYVSVIHCPNCGRKFTENMICECGKIT